MLKKFLTILMAFLTAVSVFSFSACGNSSGNTPDYDNSQNGGDNSGDKDDDNDGGGSGGQDKPEISVETFLNQVFNREITVIGYTSSHSSVLQDGYFEAGSETPVILKSGTKERSAEGKIDLKSGNMDFYEYAAEESKSSLKPVGEKYLRGWEYFYGGNGGELIYGGNIIENIGDMFEKPDLPFKLPLDFPVFDLNGFFSLAGGLFSGTANYILLSVANSFEALTLKEGEATVDLNKFAFNLLEGVKELVQSLDENSTVGDILTNETFKKLFAPVTEIVSPSDLKTLLSMLIARAGFGGLLEQFGIKYDLDSLLPEPDEQSTTYDYILKIIGSEELKRLINALIIVSAKPGTNVFLLPDTIDNIRLDVIIRVFKLGENTIEQIKEELTFLLETNMADTTQEKLYYDGGETALTAEDGKIIYVLDGYRIISQEFSLRVTKTEQSVSDGGRIMQSVKRQSFGLKIEYPETRYFFEDISDRVQNP